MRILSSRNFVAPLIDRRHLMTIILIAVFFGVVRMSNGKITTSGYETVSQQPVHNYQAPIPTRQTQSTHTTNSLSNSASSSTSNSLSVRRERLREKMQGQSGTSSLDDLLKPAPSNTNSNNKHNSLDDIEKSLGLR